MLIYTKISDIVVKNYMYGYVLYFMGIKFFEHTDKTLEELCRIKGLNPVNVATELESSVSDENESSLDFGKYPVELILQYLSHKHQEFINRKLPYLSRLIDGLPKIYSLDSVREDLKFVFPLFVEDFVQHIYDEENHMFSYIRLLVDASRGLANPSLVYYQSEKHSMEKFSLDHHGVDNEMDGIRSLTENYTLACNESNFYRLTFEALRSFEQELLVHANIENNILMPKAVILENQVRRKYLRKVKLN
ncbi:MAG: hemerythrin domain-containing protein [Cyclobacteriaceae bacterium]|nr:hemerythrin domain-containing protein [Cyclobacteriaceae bacterium]